MYMTLTPLFIQNIGLPGILLIAVVVLVMFGRGKISNLMGEVGKGITAFKKGVSEGKEGLEESIDEAAEAAQVQATHQPAVTTREHQGLLGHGHARHWQVVHAEPCGEGRRRDERHPDEARVLQPASGTRWCESTTRPEKYRPG